MIAPLDFETFPLSGTVVSPPVFTPTSKLSGLLLSPLLTPSCSSRGSHAQVRAGARLSLSLSVFSLARARAMQARHAGSALGREPGLKPGSRPGMRPLSRPLHRAARTQRPTRAHAGHEAESPAAAKGPRPRPTPHSGGRPVASPPDQSGAGARRRLHASTPRSLSLSTPPHFWLGTCAS